MAGTDFKMEYDGAAIRQLTSRLMKLDDFRNQHFEKLGKTVSEGIVENVEKSQKATGGPIKQNAPSTRLRKKRLGRLWEGRVAPLIDQLHRFIRTGRGSFNWIVHRGFVEIVPATAEMKNLSKWVQQKGYRGWYAISRGTKTKLKVIVKEAILSILREQQ